MNAIELFDANEAILEHLEIAGRVARKIHRQIDMYGRYESVEDLEQIAVVGMIEGSRKPMEDDCPGFSDWMVRCAWRAARRHLCNVHSGNQRERQIYIDMGSTQGASKREPKNIVELARDRRGVMPIDAMATDEWWGMILMPLSQREKEYAISRIEWGKTVEETCLYLTISPWEARELERSVRTKCGNAIDKYQEFNRDIPEFPSFRIRDGAFRNGRPVVDESTGRSYETASLLAREIGCDVASIVHAIRRKGGAFEGRVIRYAVGEEVELSRSRAGQTTVRIDPRSRGVACVTTGVYYRSVGNAAKSHGWAQASLYKALVAGRRFKGKLFRYATEEEVERRQRVGAA